MLPGHAVEPRFVVPKRRRIEWPELYGELNGSLPRPHSIPCPRSVTSVGFWLVRLFFSEMRSGSTPTAAAEHRKPLGFNDGWFIHHRRC